MAWFWSLYNRKHKLNPHGIALLADRTAVLGTSEAINDLEKAQHVVARKLATCKATARMIRQKWNKLRDLGKPGAPFVSPVSPEEYEDINLRVRNLQWVFGFLLLGEGFLNFLSLLILIPSDDPLLVAGRIITALVLTLFAFKVFHYWLDSWAPDQAALPGATLRRAGTTALAVVSLVAVAGISIVRARDFEGGSEGGIGIVGFGFILVSLVLPIVGGMVDRERARIQPRHRRLRKWRASLKEIRKFEGEVHRLLTEVDETIEAVTTRAMEDAGRRYAGVSDFRVTKSNYDAKRGNPVEDLTGTAAANHAAFADASLEAFAARRNEFLATVEAAKLEIRDLVSRDVEKGLAELDAAEGLNTAVVQAGGGAE